MEMRTLGRLISTGGLVRISGNHRRAGVVGVALGHNARYDTVTVGLMDADGNRVEEKIAAVRADVEEVSDVPAAPSVGDVVTVRYPGGDAYPQTTRLSVVKYVAPDGRVHVRCAASCGACGRENGGGNHRVGMFGSSIVQDTPAIRAVTRQCGCQSPGACERAFPRRCPHF